MMPRRSVPCTTTSETRSRRTGSPRSRPRCEELETDGRRQIAERLPTARAWGDLKENSEYHDAKNAQAHLETKILRLQAMRRNAVVVEPGSTRGEAALGRRGDGARPRAAGARRRTRWSSASESDPASRPAQHRLAAGPGADGRTHRATWSPSTRRADSAGSRSSRSTGPERAVSGCGCAWSGARTPASRRRRSRSAYARRDARRRRRRWRRRRSTRTGSARSRAPRAKPSSTAF